MLCAHPLYLKGHAEPVPCGQCCLCREQYAKQWAVRASVENLMHDKSVFLTLTYKPECLPEDRSVHKRDLQLFMKRLRKLCKNKKIRYFACGEYGDLSKLPHYHLIVYGISKNDPVFVNMLGRSGDCKAWPYGRCFVGDVTFQSCKYVAGYVAKKYKGKDALKHYQELGVEPEFCLSSRRPGIGGSYFDKYQDVVFNKGYVTISGKKYDIPKYFEDKKKAEDPFYDFQTRIEKAKRDFDEAVKEKILFDGCSYRNYREMNDELSRTKQANFEARYKRKRKGVLDV